MSRSVPLWVGASDDAAIPPRVKIRIFERAGGRCHWTGRKILPGDEYDFDHIVALCNGGSHSEDNLAPILRGKPHKEKTAQDVARKAKTARMKAKHLGVHPPSPTPLRSRNTFGKRGAVWPVPSRFEEHEHDAD